MKRIFSIVLCVVAVFFLTGQAAAVSLTLLPTFQEIPLGGTASVDIVVSGMGDFTAPSVGAFAVGLSYDPAILNFSSAVFGDFLGEPSSEALTFLDASAPGVVMLEEVSFLFDSDLDALQPASFTLASIDFIGISLGFSEIDFLYADLSDAFGFSIEDVVTAGAGVAPVPEPATLLLVGAGLIGLAGCRRKAKRR